MRVKNEITIRKAGLRNHRGISIKIPNIQAIQVIIYRAVGHQVEVFVKDRICTCDEQEVAAGVRNAGIAPIVSAKLPG